MRVDAGPALPGDVCAGAGPLPPQEIDRPRARAASAQRRCMENGMIYALRPAPTRTPRTSSLQGDTATCGRRGSRKESGIIRPAKCQGLTEPLRKPAGEPADHDRSARAAPAAGVLGGKARDSRRRTRAGLAPAIFTGPRRRYARLAHDHAAGVPATAGGGISRRAARIRDVRRGGTARRPATAAGAASRRPQPASTVVSPRRGARPHARIGPPAPRPSVRLPPRRPGARIAFRSGSGRSSSPGV